METPEIKRNGQLKSTLDIKMGEFERVPRHRWSGQVGEEDVCSVSQKVVFHSLERGGLDREN